MPVTATASDGTQVQLIILTFWDKVAIVAGAVGFLALLSLFMVCILCPHCLFHALCCSDGEEGDSKKGKRKIGSQKSTSSKSSYGSTESDYYYSVPEYGDLGGSSKRKPLDIIKEYDTGPSDWSSDTGSGPGLEVIKLEMQKNKSNQTNGLTNGGHTNGVQDGEVLSGTLEFSIKYSVLDNKLSIFVQEVRGLKLSEGAELVSPYISVRFYRSPKHFFTFRGSNPAKDQVINNLDKEVKTKMQRPNGTLVYKEQFEIAIPSDLLKHYTVRFLLCDMNKFSRHVTLGETSLVLKKIEIPSFGEMKFSHELRPPIEDDLGQINLGLSYLPTSEKLYLTVEDITGLKVMDRNTKSTDPCVKAFLMYDGKQLKRVKTTVRAVSLNPVFNESFSFDVPQNELDKVYFSMVVCHYEKETKHTKLIGRVYLGSNFDVTAREHWLSMMDNPRKKIVCSYKILN